MAKHVHNKILWSDSDINFLIENYNILSNTELAKRLNKTVRNVTRTLRRYNLYKDTTSVKNIKSRRNKEVGRDLSFEYIFNCAKQYQSRGEFYQFDNVCYTKANKEKWLELICGHMTNKNESIPQLMLKDLLEYIFDTNCSYNDRREIHPLEIDCYFKKWKLGFEYDGRFYHSDEKDAIKQKICSDAGILLININEKSNKYRNYELNIKSQLVDKINIINERTGLNISPDVILDYQIKILHKNKLSPKEVDIVKGKAMSEIRMIDLSIFKKIKRNKLYENIELEIVNDLKPYRRHANLDEYMKFLKSLNYDSFDILCKTQHPHRVLQKWNVDIHVIKEMYDMKNKK